MRARRHRLPAELPEQPDALRLQLTRAARHFWRRRPAARPRDISVTGPCSFRSAGARASRPPPGRRRRAWRECWHVDAGRLRADEQLGGDLRVRAAGGEQLEDLAFSSREVETRQPVRAGRLVVGVGGRMRRPASPWPVGQRLGLGEQRLRAETRRPARRPPGARGCPRPLARREPLLRTAQQAVGERVGLARRPPRPPPRRATRPGRACRPAAPAPPRSSRRSRGFAACWSAGHGRGRPARPRGAATAGKAVRRRPPPPRPPRSASPATPAATCTGPASRWRPRRAPRRRRRRPARGLRQPVALASVKASDWRNWRSRDAPSRRSARPA